MVESSNNQQLNTFTGGMNLDLGNALLPESSYREAYNLRLTTDTNSNSGTLHNIEGVKFDMNFVIPNKENWTIVNTSTIRDYGLVIAKHKSTSKVSVFRFKHLPENTTAFVQVVGKPNGIMMPLSENISVVTRYEDGDNIKMYIADGENPIRSFNVAPTNDTFNQGLLNDSSASIYPSVTFDKVSFLGLGSGNLPAGCVQYGYQLFNKNGSETEVSPLTGLISIPGGPAIPDKSIQAVGLGKDKSSDKSVRLKINISDRVNFTRMKVVGVYYTDRASIPRVMVLRDQKIPKDGVVFYEDKTGVGISELSIEEFQMVTNVHFAPAIIESKNNYLFASNITYKDSALADIEYDARAYRFYNTENNSPSSNVAVLFSSDDTHITASQQDIVGGIVVVPESHDCINPYNNTQIAQGIYLSKPYNQLSDAEKSRYDLYPCSTYVDSKGQTIYGGIGKNVEYSFIVGDLAESESKIEMTKDNYSLQRSPECSISKQNFEGMWSSNVSKSGTFVNQRLVKVTDSPIIITPNYSNSVVSHYFKSLQRDEVYRYGAILYDKFGQASDVKWIGDIRTPSINDKGFESFAMNRMVGFTSSGTQNRMVELAVRPIGITFKLSNLPENVVSYEIVRCERTAEDRSVLSQGLMYKLMQGSTGSADTHNGKVYPPVFPAYSVGYNQGDQPKDTVYASWSNPYYGFVSPETVYTKDTFEQLISGTNVSVELKKAVSSIIQPDSLDESRVAVTPRNNSGAILNWKNDTANWVISNDDKSEESYFVFKYYVQSNAFNVTADQQIGSIIMPGNVERCGLSYDITSAFAPKDIPWSDYDKRDDYLESFATVLYRNWVLMSLTGSDGRDEGANGRTLVFESKNLYKTAGSLVYTGDFMLSTNTGLTSNFKYNASAGGRHKNLTKSALVLCNLKRSVIPYGGNDYASRQFSTYIACGGFNNKPSTIKQIDVFGGDTFIGVFDWCKTHYTTTPSDKIYSAPAFVYVPVETSVNLALTQGPEYHRSFSKYLQCEPGNVNNKYTQDTPLYTYNAAYSSQGNAKLYTPLQEYDELNKVVDTRTYHSEPKTNDEIIDSWTKFKPINYIDVDTRYGKLTNLRAFGNELIFWQEHALGKFSVLERTMITDESNSPLMLGTGGVLSRYDYVATTNGMKDGHNDCDTQSDTTLYWYDEHKQEICAYNNNHIDQISKSKYVHSYVRRLSIEKSYLRERPFLSYDKFYNEVLCFLSTEDALVYNEREQVFSGFYTIVPDFTLLFGREVYMLKSNSLYKYNSDTINLDFDGNALPIEFKYVVNKNYTSTKVFDNVEFTGLFVRDHIRKISFNTETMDGRDITPADITDRELNYRFAVPRMKSNALFKNRLRGRYMECKFIYDLIGQSTMYLVSHEDEYLNTYDDKYMVTNKPAGTSNKVSRQLKYYATDSSKAETFEIPYIRTTFRASLS